MKRKFILLLGLGAIIPTLSLLAEQPIAYYTFNGNATDQSGNGYNATVQGNYSYVPGGGITLDGDGGVYYSDGGRVLFPELPATLNNGFSLSVWVKDVQIPSNPVGEEYFISFGADDDPFTGIGLNNDFSPSNPDIEWYVDTGLGGALHLDAVQINDHIGNLDLFDNWTNLVLTYEPGKIDAYVDGFLFGSVTDPALDFEGFPTPEGGLNTHWFDSGSSSSARMTAIYDDVAIYGSALTQAEVTQIFNDGVSAVPDRGPGIEFTVATMLGMLVWATRQPRSVALVADRAR